MKSSKMITGIGAAALLSGIGLFSQPARATVYTYTIDPSQSSLFVSGNLTGNTATEQTSGSLSVDYSGSIKADLTSGKISFPGGSSVNAGLQGADQEPDSSDLPGSSAPANYGRTAPGPFSSTAFEALRDINLDVQDDTSGLGINLSGTNFDSGSLIFVVNSGTSDTDFGTQGVQVDLSGKGTANGSGGGFSTLIDSGNTETLTLKVDSGPIGYSVEQTADSTIAFSGTIVATRTLLPEPASMALLGLAGIGLLRRRRR